MTQKRSAKDRTAAEWKSVAKATRRRRRILQAGFFFASFVDNRTDVQYIDSRVRKEQKSTEITALYAEKSYKY